MSNGDELALREALQSDPDDHESRLVYADWLDDRGDPRATYLRLEIEFAAQQPWRTFARSRPEEEQAFARYESLFDQLVEVSQALDPAWIEQVALPMDVVLYDWNGQKIPAIKVVREIVNFRLMDCKLLVEACPTCVAFGVSFPRASRLMTSAWNEVARRSNFGRYEDLRFGVQRSGETPFRYVTDDGARRYQVHRLSDLRPLTPRSTPMDLVVLGGRRDIYLEGTTVAIQKSEEAVASLGSQPAEPLGRSPFPAIIGESLDPKEQTFWIQRLAGFADSYDGDLFFAFRLPAEAVESESVDVNSSGSPHEPDEKHP